MPRTVRNFWVEVEIDGRRTRLRGGPARKDGGLNITIYQRDRGTIVPVLDIIGFVKADLETLVLTILPKPAWSFVTQREEDE